MARIFEDARFRHLASRSYPFTQPMPATAIVDRALSTSFIAVLPQDEQDIVRARITRIIESDPSLAGRDVVQFPYVTELHVFAVAR